MTRVGMVILNWNRPADTIECLASIQTLSLKKCMLSVIVVDNASTDDSVSKIQSYKSQVKIIKNKENLGFAGGNNVGIKYALKLGMDYVMVLNNDTLLASNIVDQFLASANRNPDFGILSPKIYFKAGNEFHKDRYKTSELGKVIWYAGGAIDWDNVYAGNIGVDEVDRGQFAEVREVDFATGTCMFIRASALRKIGGFDEKYFMYFEDVDLSLRMKNSGWRVLFDPEAVLWHKVAQSSGIGSDLNDYFITRNRLVFGMRYASRRTKIALMRESIRHFLRGRDGQRKGVRDFYMQRLGKGSWL